MEKGAEGCEGADTTNIGNQENKERDKKKARESYRTGKAATEKEKAGKKVGLLDHLLYSKTK